MHCRKRKTQLSAKYFPALYNEFRSRYYKFFKILIMKKILKNLGTTASIIGGIATIIGGATTVAEGIKSLFLKETELNNESYE